MDPSYETVVDTTGMVWTLVPYAVHGIAAAAQLGLAAFLLFSVAGILGKSPDSLPISLRCLGMKSRSQMTAGFAMLRFLLGIVLLLPLAVGAPAAVSGLAALAAVAVVMLGERGRASEDSKPGRWARRLATTCGFAALLMMAVEREDNVALGVDLLANAAQFRNEELGWQLETDRRAPKVGDLAPDFTLQDPEGQARVRLSDFRGKRPVALVFGSYT